MSSWPRDVLVVMRVRKLSGRYPGEFRVWTERHLSHLMHSRTFWCGVLVKDLMIGTKSSVESSYKGRICELKSCSAPTDSRCFHAVFKPSRVSEDLVIDCCGASNPRDMEQSISRFISLNLMLDISSCIARPRVVPSNPRQPLTMIELEAPMLTYG